MRDHSSKSPKSDKFNHSFFKEGLFPHKINPRVFMNFSLRSTVGYSLLPRRNNFVQKNKSFNSHIIIVFS